MRAQQPTYIPPHGTLPRRDAGGVGPGRLNRGVALVGSGGSPAYVDGRYVLGPAEMSGSIIKSATANLNSQTDQWEVDLTFTSRGSTEFNKYAAAHYACYQQDPSNPPYCALQAIELDAVGPVGPGHRGGVFPGGATINGSSSNPFTQQQAQNLALALSYGSLPVRFVPQDISSVSPQIGTDSLKAGAVGRRPRRPIGAALPHHLLPGARPRGGRQHLRVGGVALRHNHTAQRRPRALP